MLWGRICTPQSEGNMKKTHATARAGKHRIEELRPRKTRQTLSHEQQFIEANRRLAASEQQLRATNQQLRAHEQQLKAANQKLTAKEQQLRAANQQLRAHEQQLRAALQQLRAREQQLRAHEQQLRAANQQLEAHEQQLKAANQQLHAHEEQLIRLNRDLQERIKDLNCLYGIAGAIARRAIIGETFRDTLSLIQARWYPDSTRAAITFDGQQFVLAPFEKTRCCCRSGIRVGGTERGYIEVCRLGKRGGEPFTAEERNLINAVAQALGEAAARKEVEDALVQERNMLRTLIDIIPDSIYIKDTQSRFIAANLAVSRFMGAQTPDQVVGKSDFDFYPEQVTKKFYADEQQIVKTGQPIFNKDEPNKNAQGDLRWILTSKVPLRDSRGRVVGVVGIGRDFTELREAQERLRRAKEAAEAANRAKSQFLANMSHEIRTPINAVISIAKTLARYDTANLTDKQREGLEIIYKSSQRLLMLINDILDLSKIESGKMDLRLKPLSIDALIAGLRSMVKTLNENPNVRFFVEKSPAVPATVVSDAEKLHEILTNILSNSVKFTEQGKITLRVYTEPQRLCFSVTDTGIGIAKEHLDHIFDEFMQVDSSTTRKYQGSGLGLTISRKVVELLGGGIKAESELGKGTAVSFFVPLVIEQVVGAASAETEEKKNAGAALEASAGARLAKILIAEDDEFSRAAVRMMLENRYHLTFAKDGREAVEKYFSGRPDIVLMDIMMPNMDGYQAFEAIKKKADKPLVPIIALTAKAMKNDRDELLAHGFTDYIPKPIDDEMLVKTIDRYLQTD